MLKVRIIPILLIKGSSIVKTIKFDNHRIVGDAISTIKVFSKRMADEMIILDIDAYKNNYINISLMEEISKFCFMPLSIGGGIKSAEDAKKMFFYGADKIVINSIFYENPEVLKNVANLFGNQSIIFSLDYLRNSDNEIIVTSNSGKTLHNYNPIDIANKVADYGAGEILLNCIDRDGVMGGYDLEFIQKISNETNLPIIAAGGCGLKKHFLEAFNSGATSVSAGSIFYWVGESLISIKKYLNEHSIDTRLI